MQAIRRMSLWKKAVVIFGLAIGGVLAYSLVYNYPIRFRSKWSTASDLIAAIHPSGEKPDNIVIIPASDMSTSITIRWRTSDAVDDGVVRFAIMNDEKGEFQEVAAVMTKLHSVELKSDKTVHCYSAMLSGLMPGATYFYRVGSEVRGIWSEGGTFSTAPASPESFSFIYIGDTQKSPERVGKMLADAEKKHPETAFYMIGGDLVDVGDLRNLWDDLLASLGEIFAKKPVAAAMGNHDFGDDDFGATIYNAYFSPFSERPEKPDEVPNYSFRYGDVHFIVVNSLDVSGQTKWLEKELQAAEKAGSTFTIVMFHLPVYNVKKNRSNRSAQKKWVPLFDKYKVDLVLTGHDHSYMRSKPLKSGREAKSGEFGTTYIVATGCDKFYPFQTLDIAERQYADVATYQLITVQSGDGKEPKLFYTAYGSHGDVLDRFEKTSGK